MSYSPDPYQPPGGNYQPVYYAPAPSAGLSIASMILGIASLVGFGVFLVPQIVGVVLGHRGLRREFPQGRSFSIAGLVMNYLALVAYGLVWIIVAVLLIVAFAAASSSGGAS